MEIRTRNPFLKVFLCLCSCATCCRTDFWFCQQDLGQHRTRGSHGRTGWPASPDLQNLEKEATSTEKSGEKGHYHHHVLSCCNYAPLCMPFNPECIHIVCHTNTHTTSCVCMYVCLFQPCTCTTYTLASVLCILWAEMTHHCLPTHCEHLLGNTSLRARDDLM